MTRIFMMTLATIAAIALASPASAAHRHKRTHSETGPLMMSGTMVPYSARRARASAAAICRPVTIRVR